MRHPPHRRLAPPSSPHTPTWASFSIPEQFTGPSARIDTQVATQLFPLQRLYVTEPPAVTHRIIVLVTSSLPTFVDIGRPFGGESTSEDSVQKANKSVCFHQFSRKKTFTDCGHKRGHLVIVSRIYATAPFAFLLSLTLAPVWLAEGPNAQMSFRARDSRTLRVLYLELITLRATRRLSTQVSRPTTSTTKSTIR